MTTTMRAVVLSAPGPVENLAIRELPMLPERDGWVRIRVEPFGLDRSELHTRLGLAEGVTFPRVPGIECAGVVDAAPPGSGLVPGLVPGQKAVALMGGMGRTFDGGYAEYTSVPVSQVIPVTTDLPWEVVGALPEMIQTAYGSLTTGLDLRPGQSLLIRGGTSSVGLAAAALAKDSGATVLATTRRPERASDLARRRPPDRRHRPGRRRGPRDTPRRRRRGPGAHRHADAAGHPALGAGTRHGLLHRHALQPVGREGLLPDRLHPRRLGNSSCESGTGNTNDA